MKGPHFVLAMGRSGTMWLAAALREAASLDARHESVDCWERSLWPFGEVEVNSIIWDASREIRAMAPDAKLVHLVRDGRDVVRSVLSRPRPGRTLRVACEMWRDRNVHLREMIGPDQCYRMEDLVKYQKPFNRMAIYLGGHPNRKAWKDIRKKRINASERYIWPPFDSWRKRQKAIFWKICGPEMEAYGYGGK